MSRNQNEPQDAVPFPPIPEVAFKPGAGVTTDPLRAWAQKIPAPQKWEYPLTVDHLVFVVTKMLEKGFELDSAKFLVEVICDDVRREYEG